MTTIVTAKIQLRKGTAAQWTSANPVLLLGEYGYETDTGKQKIGDGVTAWTSLAYYYNPNALVAAIDAHELESNPHPVYLTAAEGDATYSLLAHTHSEIYEPANANLQSHVSSTSNPHSTTAIQVGADAAGTAAGLIATHESEVNPHPVYLTTAEGDAAYEAIGSVSGHAAGSGVHSIAGVTGLQTALDGKSATTHNHAATYAPAAHNHAASEITSGTIATELLGSGTANSGTYLRGDQTWAAAAGGVASDTHAATSKTTPVDTDELPLIDSAAGWVLKKLTLANIKAWASGLFAVLAGKSGGQTIIGGTGVTDKLVLQGTSGDGTSTSTALEVIVGNNGNLSALTIANNGQLNIGTLDATSILTQSQLISATLFGAL